MAVRPEYRVSRWVPLASLAIMVLAVALPALAEEAPGNPTQVDRYINAAWALGVFFVLLAILGRYAWKPVMKALRDREQAIADIVGDAERRGQESEKLLSDYRARLEAVHSEASKMLELARTQAAAAREDILKQAKEAASATVTRAQREIEIAKRDALQQIYQTTAELATAVAGKILHRELKPDDHRRLVTESLEKLKER